MINRIALFVLLAASGVAIACNIRTDVPPPPSPVTVSLGQTAQQAISQRLHQMYGNNHRADEVMFAAVAIRTPGGGSTVVPFTKPCNQTYQQAGQAGSASSGGGGYNPGGSTAPGGSTPWPGCISGCGIVTVG